MFKKIKEVVSTFKKKNKVEISDEVLKENLLEIVRQHRLHCNEDCGTSLFLLRKLAEKAGLYFTEDDGKLFF